MSQFHRTISWITVDGTCIARFPQEILHQILCLCVSAPSTPPARPSWHVRQQSCNRSRAAALLVCKSWLRIATPAFYKTVLLQSEQQAIVLSSTLAANPSLGRYVRNLVIMGVWSALGNVVKLCPGVVSLDLTLDGPREPVAMCRIEEIEIVLSGLQSLDIRNFILRKLPNAYVTQYEPRFIISHLSKIVPKWQRLETVHIAFPLSTGLGVILALATALACSPSLRILRTQLPVMWSPVLLKISENPHLKKIELWNLFHTDGAAMVSTGLFLKEARRHQRLADLIKAGTRIIRARAHTVGGCELATGIPIRTEVNTLTSANVVSSPSLFHHLSLHG